MNKQGKQTNFEDFIKIGFLFVIVYLLVKAFGWI